MIMNTEQKFVFVLHLWLNSIVWALLYRSGMFSSANPRADSAPPIGTESNLLGMSYSISASLGSEKSMSFIMTVDNIRQHTRSQNCLCQWTDTQGYTSVCKLTTHLWPRFKPYVREISTWEGKTHPRCWHRHSFVCNTALCCTKRVTNICKEIWQKIFIVR